MPFSAAVFVPQQPPLLRFVVHSTSRHCCTSCSRVREPLLLTTRERCSDKQTAHSPRLPRARSLDPPPVTSTVRWSTTSFKHADQCSHKRVLLSVYRVYYTPHARPVVSSVLVVDYRVHLFDRYVDRIECRRSAIRRRLSWWSPSLVCHSRTCTNWWNRSLSPRRLSDRHVCCIVNMSARRFPGCFCSLRIHASAFLQAQSGVWARMRL